jgi:hypothetical protein
VIPYENDQNPSHQFDRHWAYSLKKVSERIFKKWHFRLARRFEI